MTAFSPVDRNSATPYPSRTVQFVRSAPRWTRGAVALAVLAVVALSWALFGAKPAPASAPPLPTVTVAMPLQREVAEWNDYVGRFAPSQSVEIRPRVSGAVTAVRFHDGDIVKKGQLLFVIDPRPFNAALAEARAGVASARSALALARADLGRASRLIADEAVSAGEVDSLKARVQSARASLAAAEARVAARALDVEFTQVRAPISGRVSDRRIDIGNLVAGGEGASATLLTTLNALDPIYFTFDASEALYLKAQRAKAGGEGATVEVRLQDETGYSHKGRLDFTDNGLDPKSGTIRGRAVLRNPELFLTPGMFGNMRLSAGGTTRALLIPDSALSTDQARKIVMTVATDGTLQPKPVTVGPVIDGLRIIRSGLTPKDRVVLAGAQMSPPGSKVQVRPGRIEPRVMAAAAVSAPVTGDATFAR